MSRIPVIVLPREILSWDEFRARARFNSIALDGVVKGGPAYDEANLLVNFDHHDGVVREATMSTANQVYFAIKSGLMERFGGATIYVNDSDQDTSFAVWLLRNWRRFQGVQSYPIVNRLLQLTDRWDITGGAFPMILTDGLVEQHNWVFAPYTTMRKAGTLAKANTDEISECIDAIGERLDRAFVGEAGTKALDTRYEILYSGDRFKIVDEIGGNEARYALFSQGLLHGYVSIVARRPDGRTVYTIGRRSRYVNFNVPRLYEVLSAAEPMVNGKSVRWGGSDIIGGSDRFFGSGLTWEQIRDLVIAE